MLTIKHVESNFHESIVEAESVGYEPRTAHNPATVFGYSVPGWANQPAAFSNGNVFVMNDKGRTIATYRLDADNLGPAPEPAPEVIVVDVCTPGLFTIPDDAVLSDDAKAGTPIHQCLWKSEKLSDQNGTA